MQMLVVDEEDPVEHTVLAHQVFCRRDSFIAFCLFALFSRLLLSSKGKYGNGYSGANRCCAAEKLPTR